MNDLYEVLEICLREIETGADVESVLFRYPALADELRPILEASVGARNMAVPVPSAEVVRRNRAKVLQHAAKLREAKTSSSQRLWFASLRRLAVTLVVVAALFIGGTGLVRAAANTLPGDGLYPVKRTWEDLSLLLTLDPQLRETIEVEHENERVYEVQKLLAEGRSAEVDFSGWVTSQNRYEWTVSPGVTVVITNETELRDGPIRVGNAVRVRGQTQVNGVVLAERIRLLESDDELPTIGEQPEIDSEDDHEGPSEPDEDNSGPGSGEGSSEPEFEPEEQSFEGVVVSVENNILVVNGIEVDISGAEIRGTPVVGLSARVRGYYDANGVFIVTRIEFREDDSGGGSDDSRDSNESSDSDNDSNENDDNSGPGSGSDHGGNDNSDDDSGSKSGSGNNNNHDEDDNDDNSGSGGDDNSGPGGSGDED